MNILIIDAQGGGIGKQLVSSIKAVSYTHLDVYKRQVETSASPSTFLCFSIMELKPPMVSASSPLIEPLRSRIKTISVKFFQMCIRDRFIFETINRAKNTLVLKQRKKYLIEVTFDNPIRCVCLAF